MKTANLCFVAFLGLATISGCKKAAPAEATASLRQALTALQNKNKAGFIAKVLPEDRGKLKLSQPIFFGSKSVSAPSLDQVLSIKFFTWIKSFKIDQESEAIDDTTAEISVFFHYPDRSVGSLHFTMKKTASGWQIDMRETIGFEARTSGANSFSVVKAVR